MREYKSLLRNNAEGLTSLSFLPFLFERARVHICKSSLEFLLAPSKHTLGDPDHCSNWKSQHTLRSCICVLGMHTVAELPWQSRWCFCTSWVTAGLGRMKESLSETKGSCENCWWADLCVITREESNMTVSAMAPSRLMESIPLLNLLCSHFCLWKDSISHFWLLCYLHSWQGRQERV